jgi:hypothetical protein
MVGMRGHALSQTRQHGSKLRAAFGLFSRNSLATVAVVHDDRWIGLSRILPDLREIETSDPLPVVVDALRNDHVRPADFSVIAVIESLTDHPSSRMQALPIESAHAQHLFRSEPEFIIEVHRVIFRVAAVSRH